MSASGTLYVIGTPIGNLEDITLRALRILKTVDCIAAEDTRHSGLLLHYYGIKKPMVSYFEHNKKSREPQIIEWLLSGKSVGLVTDAGMPGISDPGSALIEACIAAGIPVTVIPGPTALITALAASGLDTAGFAFGGFMPRENKPRKQWLAAYGEFRKTVVFYESPRRLLETLTEILGSWGDRRCCVARELTKQHEEFIRGTLSEVLAELGGRDRVKGEIVVAVAGADTLVRPSETWEEADLMDLLKERLDQGLSKKEASQSVAEATGRSKRELYNLLVREARP